MKELQYFAGYHARRLLFIDDEQADLAYQTLKTAMSEAKDYGNDRTKTVTFKHLNNEVTVALGSSGLLGGAGLVEVGLVSLDATEIEACRQLEEFKKKIKEATGETENKDKP